jgi:hypothetical protein
VESTEEQNDQAVEIVPVTEDAGHEDDGTMPLDTDLAMQDISRPITAEAGELARESANEPELRSLAHSETTPALTTIANSDVISPAEAEDESRGMLVSQSEPVLSSTPAPSTVGSMRSVAPSSARDEGALSPSESSSSRALPSTPNVSKKIAVDDNIKEVEEEDADEEEADEANQSPSAKQFFSADFQRSASSRSVRGPLALPMTISEDDDFTSPPKPAAPSSKPTSPDA